MSICAPCAANHPEETLQFWLCKAELRRPRMPLRVPSAAGQLRRNPFASGGDCTFIGGNGILCRANA
jgi:hypothetical protein